jgi:hypothetical protein
MAQPNLTATAFSSFARVQTHEKSLHNNMWQGWVLVGKMKERDQHEDIGIVWWIIITWN